jgi:hypothetical protein
LHSMDSENEKQWTVLLNLKLQYSFKKIDINSNNILLF